MAAAVSAVVPVAPGPLDLIILDFDGVVVDSELLSNSLVAEFLTKSGVPTTTEQAMTRYMGRRWADIEARIAQDHLAATGRPAAPDFMTQYRTFENGRMRRDVLAVPGVATFLAAHAATRFCVASSSTPDWLEHGADKFNLRPFLGTNLFSATLVKRGKPAPDIFLYAADRMGVAPHKCAVIEDSAAGVEGAVAAGMTAIGFLGGAHIRKGHDDKLLAAGAHAIANTFGEVAQLLRLHLGSQHAS